MTDSQGQNKEAVLPGFPGSRGPEPASPLTSWDSGQEPAERLCGSSRSPVSVMSREHKGICRAGIAVSLTLILHCFISTASQQLCEKGTMNVPALH